MHACIFGYIMAVKGQKFTLDLDADDFQFDVHDDDDDSPSSLETFNVVREIKEREPTDPPPPPRLKSKSGFPEHRPPKTTSRFKQQKESKKASVDTSTNPHPAEPSDRAIAHHIGQKYGFDTEAKEKARISDENKRKLANMSAEEIEQARNELMTGLNPAFIQRLLSRANIEEDQSDQHWHDPEPTGSSGDSKRNSVELTADGEQGTTAKKVKFAERVDNSSTTTEGDIVDVSRSKDQTASNTADKQLGENVDLEPERQNWGPSATSVQGERVAGSSDELTTTNPDDATPISSQHTGPSTHFPVPPRDAAAFPELDPNSATFLEDLRSHYFPDTPHDPTTLTWLQDPTDEENATSAYASTQHAYAPSDIRFDFAGRLIPPSESESIPSSKGLHHHGEAPNSAGYTIPELAMLCRSSLPNQRCIAYQTIGRILYRLGRGDFGPKGTELHEGLWACIEQERPLEVIMAESNRKGGHVSAKTYATEALWLWRRGGGGDRGILKQGQTVVR